MMLKIHCGDDLLFTQNGYTSTLFVETDLGCFPSDNWTDFPEAVLQWWVDVLKSVFIGSDGRTYTFPFMDGPYAIRCRKEGKKLTLRFERENTVVLPACNTTLDEFSTSVRTAVKAIIRQLYLSGHSDKIEPIQELLRQLDTDYL